MKPGDQQDTAMCSRWRTAEWMSSTAMKDWSWSKCSAVPVLLYSILTWTYCSSSIWNAGNSWSHNSHCHRHLLCIYLLRTV